ncbi:chloride channel protein, partial [Nostocoides japonicum]|uniref:chloride channel protein n=1 Tax=Nostocoides japonicum TaxID=99481 RepID=UPI00065B9167
GREGAPREVGALAGGWFAARFGLDPQERRLLLAAGAGAGLAAVYDVPVSGVVFAAIALGSAGVGDVVVLAVASGVATVLAWPVVGRHSVYAVPHVSLGTPGLGGLVPWAVVGALPCAAAAIALNVVARRAMGAQPGPSWRLPIATTLAMLSVGVATVWWPGLPGNGKGLVELAIRPAQVSPEAGRAAATFAVLLVLKIVLTGLCLRGGIVGGLLTPALATGAALGAAVGLCLVALTGGGMTVGAETAAVAAYGLVGAAGVLSVSHRSALFATVMVWELTHVAWPVVVACAVCAVLARLAARAVGRG